MACTAGSVKKVADNHVKAADEIKKLEDALKAQNDANKTMFFSEIDSHLASAKITDARQLEYASDMKIEYTSEFSLDKIAAVVVSVLKAAIAANNPTSPTPGMDKEAIEAYTMVVNTVAEAAKSNSQSSSSLSFSMSRLCPGMFAFLMAKSTNILDEDTFGSEAVTATSIFYRVMQSIDDIKNQAEWGLTVLDAKNLIAMKVLQLGLTKRLAEGGIDIDTWVDLDSKYEGLIQNLKDRLAEHGWEGSLDEKMTFTIINKSMDETITTLDKLRGMSLRHQNICRLIEQRISSKHYLMNI